MAVARPCTCKKKNTHKQPAVPSDEHGDVTKADNASVDEGSQGPPKCRRRLKSEIDTFSCSQCPLKYGTQAALYTHIKYMVHDCGQDVSIMEEQLTLYANVTDELLEEFKSDDDSDGILMSA